jgi:RNA-dependent RNA polymerase
MKTNPSPVNPRKYYYEPNTLPAQAIDFGTRVADKTMIVMHTADSSNGDITMMLNLSRKELDFIFSLKVDVRVRKFRFQLPIALLSHVYKVNDPATGQPTLIIPFDSPPQFYMQKKEGEYFGNGQKHTSFSKNDRLWTEWNTWFRETDVVKDVVRRSFQGSPLMSRKDMAIIDIGGFCI